MAKLIAFESSKITSQEFKIFTKNRMPSLNLENPIAQKGNKTFSKWMDEPSKKGLVLKNKKKSR